MFFYTEPLAKINFNDDQKTDHYHIVSPLPPTLYDIHRSKRS